MYISQQYECVESVASQSQVPWSTVAVLWNVIPTASPTLCLTILDNNFGVASKLLHRNFMTEIDVDGRKSSSQVSGAVHMCKISVANHSCAKCVRTRA